MSNASLPSDCRFVPVFPGEEARGVRLCAVVQGAATGPRLVRLAAGAETCAWLGGLVDAAGGVLAWLELWVQASAGNDPGGPATNPEVDAGWARWVAALEAMDASSVVRTGFEQRPAPPLWLDAAAGRAVVPTDAGSGLAYEVCRDDAALLVAGLESFSESRVRFLHVKGEPSAGFLAVGPEVPSGARPAVSALPREGAGLVAFNPEGGCLLVRRLAPLEWEQAAGVLSGGTFRGLAAGNPPVKLGGPYAPLDDWDRLQQGGAFLFSTLRGRAGRLHETLHVKLLLWMSMVRAVRAATAVTQAPHLRLAPSAFRVDLASAAGALPVLWTLRAVLAEPSPTRAVVAPGDLRYFRVADGAGASIYRPEGAGRSFRGKGELRIRRVLATGDRIQVEATLASAEVAGAAARDLVWTRVPLPGAGVVQLVGTVDAAEALAQGEARFRTAPIEPGAAVVSALRAAEGGVFPGTPFETVPLLSAPVDLWSLGVLGVQLFLGGGKPAALAVDEVISLGRSLPAGERRPGDLVREAAAGDGRWMRTLGPQFHGHGLQGPEEAAAALPLELWWDVVAVLARFFAGAGPHAYCRDFGDAPPYRLEAAYDRAVADLEALLLRSQALLLCDWPSNREVARVIQRVR